LLPQKNIVGASGRAIFPPKAIKIKTLNDALAREEQLEKQLAEKETAFTQVQQNLAALTTEKQQLASKLAQSAAVAAQLAELKSTFSAKENEIEQLKATIADLEGNAKEVEGLKQQLEEANQNIKALEEKIKTLQKEREQIIQKSKDSDKDGVSDADDKCPDTIAGAKVNADGCEIDSDKDGVVDRLDLCPNTTPGATVDKLGCAEKAKIVLQDINFALGTAKLTDAAQKSLNGVAQILIGLPGMKLEIAGYTDNIGDSKRNQQLSQKRAQAVKDYLVKQGIPADQLSAKGFGEADPIADNTTPEGRAKNRRVELHKVE